MTHMTDQTTPTRNPLEALAQAHEVEAFSLLVEVIRDPEAKTEQRLKAAELVLDRARGKTKAPETPKRDPNRKHLKAISLSMDKLLQLAQGPMQRVKQQDAIEAQFTAAPARRRPVNEHALPAPTGAAARTATQQDIDEVLS